MTFVWVSQSDGSSSRTALTEILQEQQKDGGLKNPEEFRNERAIFSDLNTASWYIRQRRGCHNTFVHVVSLERPSTFTVWSGECVRRGHAHAAHKEGDIILRSVRGITKVSVWPLLCICVWISHSVSDFFFFNDRCVFSCMWQSLCFRRLPDWRYWPRVQREVHAPTWWEYSTAQTNIAQSAPHTAVLQPSAVSEWWSQWNKGVCHDVQQYF